MSQHSSPPIRFADTLESYGGLCPSIFIRFLKMSKYKELFETFILVSVFIVSVLAIGPLA